MKCYNHPDREIVATCTECGKGLCKACASKWDPILCDECAKAKIDERQMALKRSVSLSIVVLVVGTVIGIIMAVQDGKMAMLELCVVLALGATLAINGWQWLNRIQPSMFLFLPAIGWVIYFVVKFTISYFVGWVAFPVNLYRVWKGMREAKALEEHLKK